MFSREDLKEVFKQNGYELGKIYPDKPILLVLAKGKQMAVEMVDIYAENKETSPQIIIRLAKGWYQSIKVSTIESISVR